jgi:hypothetical protein
LFPVKTKERGKMLAQNTFLPISQQKQWIYFCTWRTQNSSTLFVYIYIRSKSCYICLTFFNKLMQNLDWMTNSLRRLFLHGLVYFTAIGQSVYLFHNVLIKTC